jgi:hypothetical protein
MFLLSSLESVGMVSPNASGSNSLDMAAAAHCLYAT